MRLRNQRHFCQAKTDGTTFTSESMKKKFDWQETTKEAEAVLNGNYVDADLSEVKKLFINNLQRVTSTDATSNLLT